MGGGNKKARGVATFSHARIVELDYNNLEKRARCDGPSQTESGKRSLL